MARIFGYARPTACEPDCKPLAEELVRAGAREIFVEKSTAQARRALRERRRLIDQIAPGDTLILPGLNRLGTNFEDIMECLALLIERGVKVRLLDADFATGGKSDPAYRALLDVFSGLRSALRSEAIKANLAAARSKGGKAAGKERTLRPEQWPSIKARIGETTLDVVADELGVHRQTLWTYRKAMRELETADGNSP